MSVSKKLAELRQRSKGKKFEEGIAVAELRQQCESLAQVLVPSVEDGKHIQGGTVLVFVDEGRLKACVTDRASSQRFFIVLQSFRGLWDELDASVFDPQTDWRPSGPNGKK